MAELRSYRSADRESLIWLAICLAGLFSGIALTIWLSRTISSPWLLVPMLLPFMAGIAGAVWAIRALKRARKRRIDEALQTQGLLVDLAPTPERAQTVFMPVQHLQAPLSLNHGALGIDWLALEGSSMLLFEHIHITGSGRSTVEHTCTVIAVSSASTRLPGARHGTGAMAVTERARFLNRRMLRRAVTTFTVGDPAFDKAWVTYGDGVTAGAFLTDRVRQILATSPKGEVWVVGAGFVCCAYRGVLKADALMCMLDRARRVLEA